MLCCYIKSYPLLLKMTSGHLLPLKNALCFVVLVSAKLCTVATKTVLLSSGGHAVTATKNSSSQWGQKALKSPLRGHAVFQPKVVRFLCRPSASNCVQLLADEEYLTETVHKVVLPPARDVQFFKTMLLVHAKPLLFQPATSDTATATAKATYHHSGTKVSPE